MCGIIYTIIVLHGTTPVHITMRCRDRLTHKQWAQLDHSEYKEDGQEAVDVQTFCPLR